MDARQLRSLFLNWVAADNLPFNLVESETFRAFLNYVNPFADTLLPLSHNTIRKDLTATIKLRLPAIIKLMANAKSKIHLVYDGWTSDHNLLLFGVQARYLDEYKRLQTILLSLPQIHGEHTGEKFADITFAVTE